MKNFATFRPTKGTHAAAHHLFSNNLSNDILSNASNKYVLNATPADAITIGTIDDLLRSTPQVYQAQQTHPVEPATIGYRVRQVVSFIVLFAAWFLLWAVSLSAASTNGVTNSTTNGTSAVNTATTGNSAVYSAIDKYALEAPKSAEKSPEKLAAYLMRACVNDVEKARAVARWMSANITFNYDAANGSGKRPSDHPDSVFRTRTALSGGYASLFVKMMRSLGIETVSITGYKKGFGYTPGDTTTLKRHTWNAFHCKGQWMLVDVPVYKEVESGDGAYRTTYADAFFCIEPEQLSFTHFPDDAKWQLLTKPISREQFLNRTQYFGAFYGHPVKLVSHKEYAVNTKNRTVTMEFEAPEGTELAANVYGNDHRSTAKWTTHTASANASANGSTCNRRVLSLKFPSAGTYKVEITVAERIVKTASAHASQVVVGCAMKTLAEYNVVVDGKTKALAAKE